MHARIFLIALCQVAAAAAWSGNAGATEPTGYSITGHVPGSGGAWDYAVVDEHSRRLFLAQAGVTALDLVTNTVTTGLVAGKMTHALAPLGDGTLAVLAEQAGGAPTLPICIYKYSLYTNTEGSRRATAGISIHQSALIGHTTSSTIFPVL